MPRLHVSCKCGRSQTIVPKDEPGGITFAEACEIGWKEPKTNAEGAVSYNWTCPFCAGDTENLKKVFYRGKK